jgi:hypothetical protein
LVVELLPNICKVLGSRVPPPVLQKRKWYMV